MARQGDGGEAYVKTLRTLGAFLTGLDEGQGLTGLTGGKLTGMTIRMGTAQEPGVLVVVRACDPTRKVVGFVGALTLAQAVLMWRAKDAAAGLKWRDDVPWKER